MGISAIVICGCLGYMSCTCNRIIGGQDIFLLLHNTTDIKSHQLNTIYKAHSRLDQNSPLLFLLVVGVNFG